MYPTQLFKVSTTYRHTDIGLYNDFKWKKSQHFRFKLRKETEKDDDDEQRSKEV